MQPRSKKFMPALEGVRGYAFLVVFLVHYNISAARPTHIWLWPFFMLRGIGWLVVPIFFALSGYLITGILLDTKGREGYFKVFYGRRSVRVFPLYYLVLGLVAVLTWLRDWHWNSHYLAYLFYLQNFSGHAGIFSIGRYIGLGHLWSLAVEEHFYLLWPIVIWLCPNRSSVVRTCCGIIAACFLLRICWPLFHVSMMSGYWSTFTRADGIVCGAIVAVVEREKGLSQRFTRVCEWVCVAGLVVLSTRTVMSGSSSPMDYFDLVMMTPLANAMSTAIVVVLISTETSLSRLCSQPWICNIGRKSYGLYLFHNLYVGYFFLVVAWKLTPWLGGLKAQLVCAGLAFGLTWVLASVAYRWIEEPAMRMKGLLQYGPELPMKEVSLPAVPVRIYMRKVKPDAGEKLVPVPIALSSLQQHPVQKDARRLIRL
jgi:peptidoglycan/LPS O-acetylase OafA/YrhL